MRSILLQSRRIHSRALLPHHASSSSSSSLHRRLSSSTPSATNPPPLDTIAPSNPSLLEPEFSSIPTLISSTQRPPPPPLRVFSPSSRPTSSAPPTTTILKSIPTPAEPPLSSSPAVGKVDIPPTPSLPPLSPSDLLEFSRLLSTTPAPAIDDLKTILAICRQVYPNAAPSDPTHVETVLHFLAYANRAPPQKDDDQHHFVGIVGSLFKLLDESVPFDVASFGLDFKTDLLPLVNRLSTRGRVRDFARTFHAARKDEYGLEELDIIRTALRSLPRDGSASTAVPSVYCDWKVGFQARLSHLIESSATASTTVPDVEWLGQALAALDDRRIRRGSAYGLLERGALDAPSSLETLVAASRLYAQFAPSAHPPRVWRQNGDALVRILLLFSRYRGEPPPFYLLSLPLRNLQKLPPFFIPSTLAIPSFAIPLLPLSTNIHESLLVVRSILRAQQVDARQLAQVWSTFLSTIEHHSIPPSPTIILSSELFKIINESPPSGTVSPLEDLIQMYLRRWNRVESTPRGRKEHEQPAFETLEQFVEDQTKGNGVEYGASLFSTLMEVQAVVRKDWKAVFRMWEEAQEGAGVDAKAVEMFLLACLETSSFDQAKSLFTTIQTTPTTLPLLTPKNWSLYYSILVKSKDFPSLVEAIVFQASWKENASPLLLEDLAKGIELAKEAEGDQGKEVEEKLKQLMAERFGEALKSLSEEEGGREEIGLRSRSHD